MSLVSSWIVNIDFCKICKNKNFVIGFFRICSWISAIFQAIVLIMSCIVWISSYNNRRVYPIDELDKIEGQQGNENHTIMKKTEKSDKCDKSSENEKLNKSMNELPSNLNVIQIPTHGGEVYLERNLNEEELNDNYERYKEQQEYIRKEKAIKNVKLKRHLQDLLK